MGFADAHRGQPAGSAEWRAPVIENVKDPLRMVEVAKNKFVKSGDSQSLLRDFKSAYAESGYDKNLADQIMGELVSLTNGDRRVVDEFRKLVDQFPVAVSRTKQKNTDNGGMGDNVIDVTARIARARQKVTEASTNMLKEIPDDDWVNRAKSTVVSRAPASAQTQPTEKPGFFKRLFGGR